MRVLRVLVAVAFVGATSCVHVEIVTDPVGRLDGDRDPSERKLGLEYADRHGRPLCLHLRIPGSRAPHPAWIEDARRAMQFV